MYANNPSVIGLCSTYPLSYTLFKVPTKSDLATISFYKSRGRESYCNNNVQKI